MLKGGGAMLKVGFWLFQISNSGCGIEDVASEARAEPTSSVVIIGGGIINVVVITVGDSQGIVGVWAYNGVPGSTIVGSVDGPVTSRGRTGGHGRNARAGWWTRWINARLYVYFAVGVWTFKLPYGLFCAFCIVPVDPLVIRVWVAFPGNQVL
jgi:hypothetical protein